MKREGAILLAALIVLGAVELGANPNDGLVAHYPFDGSLEEVTETGLNGIGSGGITFVEGVFGQAASLDGLDDFVRIPSNPSVNIGEADFSVSGWFSVLPLPTNKTGFLLCKKRDGSLYPGMSCAIEPYGIIRVGAGSGDAVGHGTFSVQRVDDGVWHHFVSVREYGHVWRLYLDGAFENEAPDPARDISSAEDLMIGVYDSVFTPGQVRYLETQIDDLRVYDRALTEPEIEALFDAAACVYGPPAQPVEFVRAPGKPSIDNIVWDSCGGAGVVEVSIDRVASAWVFLNGEALLSPQNFNNSIVLLTLSTELVQGQNTLEVELRGRPGGTLAFEFLREE